MRTLILVVWALLLVAASSYAQKGTAKTLDIYLVDVEGGNATLFVAPSGESLLIDTGSPTNFRDADRIVAAANDAGIKQIDNLITTHYHIDHVGGLAELAARVPIRHLIDHGPSVQPDRGTTEKSLQEYADLSAKAKRTIVKPGNTLSVGALDVRVLTSGGQVIQKPLPSAGRPNSLCASFKPQAADPSENARSVGSLVTFGKFRALHLGDLTWNKEFDLMCPNNRIGTVDLFVVSHHGLPVSNSEVLVHAIEPRVAIMNNGTRKGGQPDAMRIIYSAPGLEDLWQLHFSLLSGQEYTVPGIFIANQVDEQPPTMPVAAMPPPQPGPGAPPPPVHNGTAHWIKVSAHSDGTFTVTNSRNGFGKTYRRGPG